MGLILFTYLTAIIMLFLALRSTKHLSGSDIRTFRIAVLVIFSYSMLFATGYLLAPSQINLALIMLRWSGALTMAASLCFLRLSITYPYGKKRYMLDATLILAAGILAWRIGTTEDFLQGIKWGSLQLLRANGPRFFLITAIITGTGALAGSILLLRSFTMRSKVYSQQVRVFSAGILGYTALNFLLGVWLPFKGYHFLYPISPLSAVLAVSAALYIFNSSRIFHNLTVAKTILSRGFLFLLFGIPLGIIVSVAFIVNSSLGLVSVLAGAIAYFVIGQLAENFALTRFGSSRDESARENLEAEIAHIDLSLGRESVLKDLFDILTPTFGCESLTVLSETESGALQKIFPVESNKAEYEHGDPILEVLSGIDSKVLLKTDIITSPSYRDVKVPLLALFESFNTEAMIVAKEGRRIIGIFIFGPKRNGSDYDELDYQMFLAIQGKLFVVAYYVRHVARESLLATVEKEIGLADQIVRSVQEHIDAVEHPSVDVSFTCRSTRHLGGDLYDSVQISPHRWFFVVGDVSGKGLNAAMSMVILKSMIRGLLREESDFIKLVSRTNLFIKNHLPRGTFFAGLFGFIALDKGSIYFINCGIPAVFFRSPGLDTVIEAQGEGRMLGIVKNIEPHLKQRKLPLTPGSTVVITTDGIVEAESLRGERYGKERIVRIMNENKGASAQAMVEAVINSATSFTDNKLDDDITILALNYHGHKEKNQ